MDTNGARQALLGFHQGVHRFSGQNSTARCVTFSIFLMETATEAPNGTSDADVVDPEF